MHRPAFRSLRRALPFTVLVLVIACSPRTVSTPPVTVSSGTDVDPTSGSAAAPGSRRAGPVSPTAPLTSEQRRWVDSVLAALDLRERVGQMVMPWVLGHYTNSREESFARIRRWIVEDRIGGVVMSLGSPIEVAAKVNAMQRLAAVPLLVASDLEPGLGRLEGGVFVPSLMSAGSATVLPNNMAVGATGNDRDAYDAGRISGREARAIGIHLSFAPTVDVNNNPLNPVINTRSYGEDAARVAALSTAFVRGLQEEGVAATLKHFPGHGDTDTDSHLALPVVSSTRARLDTVELVPFRAAIAAGAAGVMTAHIALPAVEPDGTPATLAPSIMTGLLRDSLGFEGLSVTDALTMEGVGKGYPVERSAVLAVQAGNDILLMPSDVTRAIDAVTAAVERGEISAERIERSVRRILELKARTGAAFEPLTSLDALRDVVGAPEHWATAQDIAQRAITLISDRASLVPVPRGGRVAVISYAPELEVQAGRTFLAELRSHVRIARAVRISPSTGAATLDSIAASVRGADRVLVTTHVRRIEGEGRVAIPTEIAAWIDSLARREKVVLVANGNPYLISQFPGVGTYMVTYGIGEVLERAAARAVAGAAPITGRAPVSLPGHFQRGAGLTRTPLMGQAP
jgi:beta-N-acetylhexosaminidase